MNFLNQLLGALVEAWHEVKVQKTRVILSLVGVVAAVAAMTVVIALGQLTQRSFAEAAEAFSGRETTLHINVTKQQGDFGAADFGSAEFEQGNLYPPGPTPELFAPDTAAPGADSASGRGEDITGRPLDPVGDAMTTVAGRFKIPFWSHRESQRLQLREVIEAQQTGFFRGQPAEVPEYGYGDSIEILAVDPPYQTIFRLQLLHGRWIHTDDWQQRVAPSVINEALWKQLGRPDINDPLVLNANDETARQFRVVGVVKSKTPYEDAQLYVSYPGWKYMSVGLQEAAPEAYTTMVVWVAKEQVAMARSALPSAVAAVLGEGWQGTVESSDETGGFAAQNDVFTAIIMVIGAIVIFLGALGLLNVAIVTVRQRIREIGIRRAMGASAARVFFAVFMESVVATFVAGVIGVALAIITLRLLPLETLGITLQEQPPFPMSAALIGVIISTAIGALCGIIPAAAAIKVKPIDAIRY